MSTPVMQPNTYYLVQVLQLVSQKLALLILVADIIFPKLNYKLSLSALRCFKN